MAVHQKKKTSFSLCVCYVFWSRSKAEQGAGLCDKIIVGRQQAGHAAQVDTASLRLRQIPLASVTDVGVLACAREISSPRTRGGRGA